MPKATTTSSGPRSTESVVIVAEIERGNIAIASIIPNETIERDTGHLSPEMKKKVIHDNAAALYGL